MTAWTGLIAERNSESLNNDEAILVAFDSTATYNRHRGVDEVIQIVDTEGGRWDTEATGSFATQWSRDQFDPLNRNHVSGYAFRHMEDWLYDVVHFLPIDYTGEVFPRVSVGAVTKTFTYDVQIWNAFVTPAVITATTYSQDDIAFNTTGTTLQSNELHTYELTVYGDGAATINCTVTLETSVGDWSFDVVGTRTYAPPVWAIAPVSETLSFGTWTFTSENGKEQRMSLRPVPRRTVSFQADIAAVTWLTMQHIIKERRNNKAAIPIFHEAVWTETNYYTGDSLIAVDTSNAEFYVGGYAGLMDYTGQVVHFSEVTAVTANSITLLHPLEQDIYSARIFPMIVGYFKGNITDSQKAYRPADGTVNSPSRHEVRFSMMTHEGDDLRGYTSPNTLDGYNIIEWRSEANDAADSHEIRMWDVDFGNGQILAGTSELSSRVSRPFQVTLQSKAEIWNFRRFVHTHTSRVPFWFSLDNYNLLAALNIEAGATGITVLDRGFFAASQFRSAVAVRHPDGTIDYRLIDSAVSIDENTTLISLNAALTNAVEIGSLETRISFLILGRIDGDVKMRHWGYKSQASFEVAEVYQ